MERSEVERWKKEKRDKRCREMAAEPERRDKGDERKRRDDG